MKFTTLGEKERKLLLIALGFNLKRLRCKFCEEKVSYESCGIMPPIVTDKPYNATIICGNPLCVSTYLTEVEL